MLRPFPPHRLDDDDDDEEEDEPREDRQKGEDLGLPQSPSIDKLYFQSRTVIVAGTINDKLARQVLEGVIAGEGSPAQVVEARGLKVVSDDSALTAAVDEALAAQPDVLAKIQDGKVQAAGAMAGAFGLLALAL